jgi:hypothetical protein
VGTGRLPQPRVRTRGKIWIAPRTAVVADVGVGAWGHVVRQCHPRGRTLAQTRVDGELVGIGEVVVSVGRRVPRQVGGRGGAVEEGRPADAAVGRTAVLVHSHVDHGAVTVVAEICKKRVREVDKKTQRRTVVAEAVEVHLHLVLVEELVVAGRRTALHRAEVLAPPGPSGVLLEPLLFRPPEMHTQEFRTIVWKRFVVKQPFVFLNYTDLRYLFWNQTCTTLMSSPVSWLSCSRTCLAGLGLLL